MPTSFKLPEEFPEQITPIKHRVGVLLLNRMALDVADEGIMAMTMNERQNR